MIERATVYLGVLRFQVHVPGARSLKDRRRVVVALRDRIRSRFEVSCHEADDRDLHAVSTLLVVTGGLDGREIESVLDRIVALAGSDAHGLLGAVEREIVLWPTPSGT